MKNDFPKNIHTFVGIGTVVKGYSDLAEGTKGEVFYQGKISDNGPWAESIKRNAVVYFVTENETIRLNDREVLDLFHPTEAVCLERLENVKNKIQKIVDDSEARGFKSVDEAWDLVGLTGEKERLEAKLNVARKLQ